MKKGIKDIGISYRGFFLLCAIGSPMLLLMAGIALLVTHNVVSTGALLVCSGLLDVAGFVVGAHLGERLAEHDLEDSRYSSEI